ncbi:MAG: hypothetical protein Q8O16_00200 [Dehalococcoidia bacterium]|nr:hypothetical protein [Dehalococcoidia bacterium]
MDNLPIAIVEHPMGGIAPDAAAAKADAVIEDIIEKATRWMPRAVASETRPAFPAPTVSVTDTIEEINDLFYKNAWSDGLPVIPPTEERVEKMLSGTSMKPDQLIGLIPPRMGAATVQIIAINAVMAGAKSEHLPVIIAAIKAAVHPEAQLRRWLSTTRPVFLTVFVQGPIVKELGIQYGQSALFPGPKSNAAIGRAFNLITRLLGGATSPPGRVGTMTTLGAPNYSSCLGENEDALPKGWNPLRVDCGYKLGDSVVSVFGTTFPLLQNDHDSTDGKGVLMSTCYLIGGQLGRAGGADPGGMVILFGPEHAATIARDGYSKEDVKRFIFENAMTPLENLVRGGVWYIVYEHQPERIKKMVADKTPMIPEFDRPEQITISVAGGAGKQSIVRIGYENPPPVLIQGATLTRAGR